jgi:Protein of unknown function (DUF3039)
MRQSAALAELHGRGELCRSEPGSVSHFAHRRDVAASSIEGRAVRAMCGVFFVLFQDQEEMQVCRECAEIHDLMPS